jgi:ATP-dependent Clp protease ATP-binding subunit ClpA
VDNYNPFNLDFSGYLRAREQILANSFLLSQQNIPTAQNHLFPYGQYDRTTPNAPMEDNPASPPSGSRLTGVLDASQVKPPKANTRKFDRDAFCADLTSEVIGQPQALGVLADLICLHIGKSKPNRPLTVLEVGPTGVGKTLTAEQVAKLLGTHTGRDWGYIRVDMNQLKEAHHTSKLVGTTAGYVGYDDEPIFAPLLTNPRHVVLFDEMEKANTAILQFLMNAMSNGRLELSKPINGIRCVDFTHAILLFTSNIPLSVENPEDMTQAEITRECRKQLTKPSDSGPTMPPEIAARFSEIVLYRNLSDEDKVEILGLTVMRTAEQYELTIRKIDPGFMQDIVDRTSVERGAREAVCEIESILGGSLKNFKDDHEGIKDVTLSGTSEHVIVESYTG